MTQYIDKDALVAEIEKLKAEAEIYPSNFDCGRISICKELINFLDTLSAKEVDLEEEIELTKGDYEQVDVAWNNDFDYIARHFFELGLKTKKGE